MSLTEVMFLLIAIGLAALAIYIAVKAHLHGVSLASELKNQGGKVTNLEQSVADKAKADLAALQAKVANTINPPPPPAP